MERAIRCVALVSLSISTATVAAATAGAEERKLETFEQKAAYAIGLSTARGVAEQAPDLDPKLIAAGLSDGFAGGDAPKMSDAEVRATLAQLSQRMQAEAAARMRAAGEESRTKGAAFLEANKAKDGVTTLPSGLQYKKLQSGSGRTPGASDQVKTHYRGTLIDGTEFDSSYKRGEPATFGVNQVIKGWTEALQLMKEGDKWQLVIPADLAYGPSGSPPRIPPNAVLIFDIELLEVLTK